MEVNERSLVPQLRDYSIARMGQRGEIYEAGPSGDHRLDALMLATYAYGQEHDDFLRYNFNLAPQTSDNHLRPTTVNSRIHTVAPAPNGYSKTAGGILVNDFGNWTGKGDPPDVFPGDAPKPGGGILPTKPGGTGRNSGGFTQRGDRGL